MGASLAPVLANIIMTELEREIVDDLLKTNVLKFYGRYVDDTLLLIKPESIDYVLNKFNSFDNNLQFTVDTFGNETPHFLDLEIHPDGLTIYRKDTHTGQFVNFSSYTKWNHKTAWIRSLISRPVSICSPNKLSAEFKKIRMFASYNGYPKNVVNAIFKKCEHQDDENKHNDTIGEDITRIFIATLPRNRW